MTLRCSRCHEEKEPVEFYRDASSKSGRECVCKACRQERVAQRRASDPTYVEYQREACKKSHQKHRADRLKRSADWLSKNADRKVEYNKAFYAANKENYRQRFADYYEQNKEALIARAALSAKVRSKRARDSMPIIRATPGMAKEIAAIYAEAKRLTKETGQQYHVDHIVPLRGKTVCGLHVPANLEIVLAPINQAKGNRHWPDMPEHHNPVAPPVEPAGRAPNGQAFER